MRGIGDRFGPVLRTHPPVNSAAEQLEWDNDMDDLAARRRTGRFTHDPQRASGAPRDMLQR